MSLEDLPLEDLILLCKQAYADYMRKRAHNQACVYELLRRALAAKSDDALQAVYDIYMPQFRSWVLKHPSFPYIDETAEYFASEAFTKFYFALRGERFAHFPTVGQIFQFAKVCVHNAVAQYARDHGNNDAPLSDVDFQDNHDPWAEWEAGELWELIEDLLSTDRQRKLARLVFVLGMKPAEIVAIFPEEWENERSVSVALHRIRKILRNHPALRDYRQR
ncbi:MAG: sigma-70 family RNA polymerase sigma factor [Anaerolineae bacterium]|nr:sigma-70 family RNA polymerase sigma factor [Anaerolineae bacterium]